MSKRIAFWMAGGRTFAWDGLLFFIASMSLGGDITLLPVYPRDGDEPLCMGGSQLEGLVDGGVVLIV